MRIPDNGIRIYFFNRKYYFNNKTFTVVKYSNLLKMRVYNILFVISENSNCKNS